MMLSFLLLIMLFGLSQGEDVSDYSECSTKRSVLLRALFETENNLYELNRIFVPARLPTSRHIKVTYTFLDSNNQTGDCNVTYLWAVGGFLLIQPPMLFNFNSLLFSRPANDLESLTLTLPSECRALVITNDTSNECTCNRMERDRPNYLDGLTQQLNEIAKYSDPISVVQDTTSDAQAVCEKELKEEFFNRKEVDVFLVFTVVIPFIVMVVIVITIRSVHPLLHSKLTKSSDDHPNLVGFTLSGIYGLLFILVMDCAAVHYYRTNEHEYSDYNVSGEFNLFIIPITLVFDLAVALLLLAFMLYLWCTEFSRTILDKNCTESNKCLRSISSLYVSCCILPYFYFIFGSKSQASIWRAGQRVKLLEAKLTDQEIVLTTVGKAKGKNGDKVVEVELKVNQHVTVSDDQKVSLIDCQFNLNYGQLVKLEDGDEVILKADGKALQYSDTITLEGGEKVTLLNRTQDILLEANQQVKLNPQQKIKLKNDKKVELIGNQEPTDKVEAKLITSTRITLTDRDKVEVVNQNTDNSTTNQRNIWIVTGLMFAPLFCIASHSGYILAAALTEPEKTTAAFLVALGSFLYMFSMFRQCYIVHKNDSGLFAADSDCAEHRKWWTCKNYWILFVPIFPILTIASHVFNVFCLCRQLCLTSPDPGYFEIAEPDNKDPKFSIRGFFLSCSWGILIVGVLIFVLSAFFLLPFPTFPLAEYLETIIQLVIVFLAFIITYKVFTSEDVDKKIKQYFKEFRLKNENHFEEP